MGGIFGVVHRSYSSYSKRDGGLSFFPVLCAAEEKRTAAATAAAVTAAVTALNAAKINKVHMIPFARE